MDSSDTWFVQPNGNYQECYFTPTVTLFLLFQIAACGSTNSTVQRMESDYL